MQQPGRQAGATVFDPAPVQTELVLGAGEGHVAQAQPFLPALQASFQQPFGPWAAAAAAAELQHPTLLLGVPGAEWGLNVDAPIDFPQRGAPHQGELQPLARVQRGERHHRLAGHNPLLRVFPLTAKQLLLAQPVQQPGGRWSALVLPALLQQFCHLAPITQPLLTIGLRPQTGQTWPCGLHHFQRRQGTHQGIALACLLQLLQPPSPVAGAPAAQLSGEEAAHAGEGQGGC